MVLSYITETVFPVVPPGTLEKGFKTTLPPKREGAPREGGKNNNSNNNNNAAAAVLLAREYVQVCEDQYMYWNFTCIPTCLPPLEVVVFSDDDNNNAGGGDNRVLQSNNNDDDSQPPTNPITSSQNFCSYPCTRNKEYLYEDGNCIDQCIYQARKEKGIYLFCDKGTGTGTETETGIGGGEGQEDEEEEALLVTKVNGKSVLLGFESVTTYATQGEVEITNNDDPQNPNYPNHRILGQNNTAIYAVKTTWSFFAINGSGIKHYAKAEWDSDFSCGFGPQKCGVQCTRGVFCKEVDNSNNDDGGNSATTTTASDCKVPNYCYNLYTIPADDDNNSSSTTTQQRFTLYPLKLG